MSLNVTIVTQDEPFYLPLFFEELFENIHKDIEVERVIILRKFDEPLSDFAERMYRFYGPRNFLLRSVNYLQRRILEKLGIETYSVRGFVQNNGIAVEHKNTVNDTSFIQFVSEGTDVVLSVSAPEIFGADLLSSPKWGCINVHTADLPKYRGMLPTFWALYHEEDEIGVTVHTMEEEIDRGKVLRQSKFAVDKTMSLDEVICKGKRIGGNLTAQALSDIESGSVELTEMDGEESYYSFPSREERREFEARGWSLL